MKYLCETCKRVANVPDYREPDNCCNAAMIPERKCNRCNHTGFDVFRAYTPNGSGLFCVRCVSELRKPVAVDLQEV